MAKSSDADTLYRPDEREFIPVVVRAADHVERASIACSTRGSGPCSPVRVQIPKSR